MQQEVPFIFRARLEAEVNESGLSSGGPLSQPGHLREAFIDRMTTMLADAQRTAINTYQIIKSTEISQRVAPSPVAKDNLNISSCSGSSALSTSSALYQKEERVWLTRTENSGSSPKSYSTASVNRILPPALNTAIKTGPEIHISSPHRDKPALFLVSPLAQNGVLDHGDINALFGANSEHYDLEGWDDLFDQRVLGIGSDQDVY